MNDELQIDDTASRDSFDNRAWPLLRYSGPLIYWNICVLIVNGSGLIVVGLFDYNAVAVYSIASMFVAAVIGIGNAVTTPLLAELSRRVSSRGLADISNLIQTATRLNTVFVLGLATVALVAMPTFLRISGMTRGTDVGIPLATLIIVASSIRLVGTPVTMAFIATGTHRKVLIPPMVEEIGRASCRERVF